MDLYFLIFVNSFQSSVIISLIPESAWFAALYFGGSNMWLATAMAVTGSSIGTCLTLVGGYYLAIKRNDWFAFKDSIYDRLAIYMKYAFYLLVIPFSALPGVGVFWNAFVLSAGFFGAPLKKAAGLIVISRVIYYCFWLYKPYSFMF